MNLKTWTGAMMIAFGAMMLGSMWSASNALDDVRGEVGSLERSAMWQMTAGEELAADIKALIGSVVR